MQIPKDLQPLIDDGVIDAVVRPLRSGKEASVYVVRAKDRLRCAKVYKNMSQRSFQKRVQYEEGRQMRASRHARAVGKRSRFGRAAREDAWKNTEVDALYRLHEAGVRVPEPLGYFNGVLLMELITDADGKPAPGLGEVELSASQARAWHAELVGAVARMLCAGLIHGDLSEYNVLAGPAGPVIIDLPQVVSAAGNNAARALLVRDVRNITATLARSAPELADTRHGEEMWALYARGRLRPDSPLTGVFEEDLTPADLAAVHVAIEDARREAQIRAAGRAEAES